MSKTEFFIDIDSIGAFGRLLKYSIEDYRFKKGSELTACLDFQTIYVMFQVTLVFSGTYEQGESLLKTIKNVESQAEVF